MTFTFNEADHSYTLDGVRLPSVTELIHPLTERFYMGIPAGVLETARQRGKDVHTACQLDDENDLDESTLEPEIGGYLEGWRKFRSDTGAIIVLNEKPIYHRTMRYAGTPDRVVGIKDETWLLDVKATADVLPVVHVQLCGYARMLSESGMHIHHRAALHLRPDGTYRLIETPHDEIHVHDSAFMGLLAAHRWRERYGKRAG